MDLTSAPATRLVTFTDIDLVLTNGQRYAVTLRDDAQDTMTEDAASLTFTFGRTGEVVTVARAHIVLRSVRTRRASVPVPQESARAADHPGH